MRPFVFGGAFNLVASYLLVLLLTGTLSFLASSYSGLSVGRVDIRNVHRITSLTFVTLLGLTTMMIAFHSEWVRAADPDDMTTIAPRASGASGDWMIVGGSSSRGFDFDHGFLMNVVTGEFLHLRTGQIGRSNVSRDGSRAVWEEIVDVNPLEARIFWADLKEDPREIRSDIAYEWNVSRGPSISPRGGRVALIVGDLLTVHELEGRRSILSIRLHDAAAHEVWFKEEGLIRLFRYGSREEYEGRYDDEPVGETRPIEIFEIDLSTRKLTKTGEIPLGRVSVDSRHDRLLLIQPRTPEGTRYSVHDARTGATVASRVAVSATLLSDGILFLEETDGRYALDILDPSGESRKKIDIPGARYARLGGEIAPGKLVVRTSESLPPEVPDRALRQSEFAENARVVVFDTASGAFSELGKGLTPVASPFWYWGNVNREPGALATRLFQRGSFSELLVLDPASGELRPVAGNRP